ncbi:MAG: radical SAM protein [Prosthecochloris sp.]|nr:radical SAM protein [Prosthecochloris sp.]
MNEQFQLSTAASHPVPHDCIEQVCSHCNAPLPALPPGPETVILIVTSRCNLKCPTCSYWKQDAGSERELCLEEYEALLEELAASGTRKVVLTGGEPMVRTDWKKLLQSCSAQIPEVLLLTNGTLVDEEAARMIGNLENVRVVLSWDGWSPESFDQSVGRKDMYTTILGGIERLCSSIAGSGRIGINVTITPQNMHHVPDIADLVARAGIDFFHFHLVYSNDPVYAFSREQCVLLPGIMQRTTAILDERGISQVIDHVPYAFIRHTRCFIPFAHSTVGPFGDVFGCIPAKGGFKDTPENALGNLRSGSFSRIWQSPRYRQFRTDAASGRHRDCIACLACHAARNFSAGPCRTCETKPRLVSNTPEFY